ncbi:MAG: transcription antitermination factor NusB [Eubacteriales bacterium]|nr:transcription antitermination factor NusB [Eubacteriales bacterium]
MSRRSARDTVFRLFYEYAINGAFNPATMDVMRDCFDKGMNENAWSYVMDTIDKYQSHSEAIDSMIQNNAKRWNVSHMTKVELSILRLGVCEIMYSDDIHEKITINECVELAKKYASDKSEKFINGVLAGVIGAKEVTPDD